MQKSLHHEKISLHQQASLLWALACPGEANRSQQLGKGGNKEKTHAQGECDRRLAGTNSSTRLPSTQIVCHVPPIPPSLGIRSQPCVVKGPYEELRFASLTHHCLCLAWIQVGTHSSKLLDFGFQNEEGSLFFAGPQYPVAYTMKGVTASSAGAEILRAAGCSLPPWQGAQTVTNHKHRMNGAESPAAARHQAVTRSISSHTAWNSPTPLTGN